jgi:hypothetical protein
LTDSCIARALWALAILFFWPEFGWSYGPPPHKRAKNNILNLFIYENKIFFENSLYLPQKKRLFQRLIARRRKKRHGYILRANAGQKKIARNEGKSTPGIRNRHRLSSKWTTKAAREQKRGPYAGS